MAVTFATTSGTTCLICDTPNPSEAQSCKECSAPLAIVRDALAQDRDPNLVSIMGDSNVGKTVYLGFLLDMLSQRAHNFEAVPKGAYSVDLAQIVISHMAHRMFPPKTAIEMDEWCWAYYQVCRRGRASKIIDLVMPDIAGEAVAAELESPATFRIIQNLLGRSSGTLLLVDAALAANGSAQPDFFALKMLSYIDSMFTTKKRRKIELPVAVVFTKADYCPTCFDDPRSFAQANLNRLWNMCDSRFACVEFFACSVIGSLGYCGGENDDVVTSIPLHTALNGVLEPFEWIVDQL